MNELKARLNEIGFLSVERKGTEKEQLCPFATNENENGDPIDAICGDWCPHFGEPTVIEKDNPASQLMPDLVGKIVLEICHKKTLVFSEIKDERGQ